MLSDDYAATTLNLTEYFGKQHKKNSDKYFNEDPQRSLFKLFKYPSAKQLR